MSCSYDDMQHLIKAPLFCCSMRCIFCLLLVEVIYFISIFPFLYSSFCKLPAVVKGNIWGSVSPCINHVVFLILPFLSVYLIWKLLFKLHFDKIIKTVCIQLLCDVFMTPSFQKPKTIWVVCKSVLLENKMQQSSNPNTAQAGLSVCDKNYPLQTVLFRGLKHSQAVYTRPWTGLLLWRRCRAEIRTSTVLPFRRTIQKNSQT